MWCTTATLSTALLLQWMRNKTMGMVILYIISPLCFWLEMTVKTGYVSKLLLMSFRTMLLPLLLTDVVITMLELWCMTNYLWACCNMWLVCWIMYDLGLYVGWFEILRDTRRTTGFILAQVWWFDCLGDCYCTCALINWTILLQLASEQDSTLNMPYVYLKQSFLFAKISFDNL